MAVALYMDVHVPWAITDQLRRRGVTVLTAVEDRAGELPDGDLLQRASELGCVVFTQDIRFKALAESWQSQGRPFAGLIFGHQLRGSIGRYVENLELVALASEPEEWKNVVGHLPF
jgi:hypothetical protein